MRLKRIVQRIFEGITAFLMLLMVALTLVQVVNRYGVYASLDWTEELARLDLIYYLTFLGSIVAIHRCEHLKIETLVRMQPAAMAVCSCGPAVHRDPRDRGLGRSPHSAPVLGSPLSLPRHADRDELSLVLHVYEENRLDGVVAHSLTRCRERR